MSANRGPFEPCLAPIPSSTAQAPHGIARVLASQAAHETDYPCLGVDDNNEEARIASTKHENFIRSARKFVSNCARERVDWFDEVWPRVLEGCTRAGVQLTDEEHQQLFESWDAEFPAEQEEAA